MFIVPSALIFYGEIGSKVEQLQVKSDPANGHSMILSPRQKLLSSFIHLGEGDRKNYFSYRSLNFDLLWGNVL
jgi:hypothetical protein